MRFLTIATFSPENAKAATERFKQWTIPEGITIVLPTHTLMGRHQTVSVIETDDPTAIAKMTREWRDLLNIEVIPIMESSQIVNLA